MELVGQEVAKDKNDDQFYQNKKLSKKKEIGGEI